MDEAILRKAALAMPLSNRSYPLGQYRFIEQDCLIVCSA